MIFASRPAGLRIPRRPPLAAAIAVAVAGVGLVAAARVPWLFDRTLPIGWSIPLVLFIWLRRRGLMWVAVACFVAIVYVEKLAPGSGPLTHEQRVVDFVLSLVNMGLLAAMVHFVIALIDEADRRSKLLARAVGELTAVWRSAPVGMCLANADLTDVRLNAYGAALLGAPGGENLSAEMRSTRYTIWRDGVQLPMEQSPLARAARENVFVEPMECEIAGPSGRRVSVLLAAAPVRQDEPFGALGHPGHPAPPGGAACKAEGAVAAFVDITAAKTLQRELDLRRREAEEASVRKTRFLSAVSHDIRTPANAISLLAELLGHAAATPAMHAEIPSFARDLRASSQKLVELVSDVLDFTKLDAGRAEVVETQFDLNDLIADECGQANVLAAAKGIAVHCLPSGLHPMLRTDRVKLGRIVGNLLSNAVKFTAAGQVTVTVEPTRVADLFIRVRDTGPGIPPEALGQIFDEFYQVRTNAASSDPARAGSGLGLAICRRLSVALGMRLDVESEVGSGSCFSLHVPSTLITVRPREPAT